MKDSKILPHGNFEPLSKNLWILQGTLPNGIPLPRSMTIFRYDDGRLWIHSPVAISPEKETELEAMGTPTWVVVPNSMHRMDVGHYKIRWPGIKVVCPKEARPAVEKAAPVDAVAEDEFKDGPVKALAMSGVKRTELAYEVKLESGKALVVNDLLVNTGKLPGIIGWIFEKTGRIGRFRVPGPQKIMFVYSRELFRRWLISMSKKDFSIITVSHGRPITEGASLWLKRVGDLM